MGTGLCAQPLCCPGARQGVPSWWLVGTDLTMGWLGGELQAAGGSAPIFSPYANKSGAFAKLGPFLCFIPPALHKKYCSRGSGAQSVLRASLCPHLDQEPPHRHPPFALGASQEPPSSKGCKAKVIRRQRRQLPAFSAAREAATRKKHVARGWSPLSVSCGSELRHLSCQGVTWNVSTRICFLHLPLEECWGSSSSLHCSCSPTRHRRGPWPRRGFRGASLMSPFPWAQRARSGLPARPGERAGEGSSFPCWNGARPARQHAGAGFKSSLWHIQPLSI